MRKWMCVVLLAALPAAAQNQAGQSSGQPAGQSAALPQLPQIINFSLLEALVAIDSKDMAGVFGFIPEQNAPPALADFLLHNPAKLKKFVKKGERDLKQIGGINEWDQQVYRYAVTIYSSGTAPALSKSMLARLTKLGMAPAMSLAEIAMHRKGP